MYVLDTLLENVTTVSKCNNGISFHVCFILDLRPYGHPLKAFKLLVTSYWIEITDRTGQKNILVHCCSVVKGNKIFAERQSTWNIYAE